MIRDLWLRLGTCVLVAVSLTLAGEEKREREGRKKGEEAAEKQAKEAVEKQAKGKEAEKGAADEKTKKPDVRPEDVESFRKSKDPETMEIVALYDEIEKYYAELATARNVADGEDKEARKAEKDVKSYESKIKRQTRKLESAVEKFTRPLRKDYEEAKGKYDSLREKGDQLSDQKQEKRATALYQQADRLTGKMESSKRRLDVAQWFLVFDNAVPIAGLEDGDDDDGDGDERRSRPGRQDREDFKGFKGGKPDKGDKDEK